MASIEDRPPVTSGDLSSLAPAIRALCHLLKSSQTPGIIIGGVAASLQGQARATEDVDALVRLDERFLDRFLEIAQQEGFRPRIPDAVSFARRSAVLLLEHEATRVGVDLTIGRLPFESEAIDRGQPVATGGLEFSVATPEDLIVMKAVAHRPQDLLDIRAIVRANPQFDASRVRTQVRQFAKALDMPKLWTDIAAILKPLRKRKARRSNGSRKKN